MGELFATTVERPGARVEAAPARRAPDIRRLVELAQRGDRDALGELYVIHVDRIYGYLYASVGSRHDAEDLTEQTFVKMLESIDRFVWLRAPFSAWLFRIAHNLAMDHFRRSRRYQLEEMPEEREDAAAPSAEERAFHSIGDVRMLELVDGLSHDQRQVLTLKFGFDFTNANVAVILGKSEGAVKALQHRALAALQASLAHE
jgi:RNA polymerase sigma-70 factor (ECF subfamily)